MDSTSVPAGNLPDVEEPQNPQSSDESKWQPKQSKKRLIITSLIIGVIVGAAGIAAGYWYLANRTFTSPKASTTAQTKPTDPYAGWKTFTDSAVVPPTGISIKYPSDWQVNTAGTKTYGWSITSAAATITVNDLFLDSSKTARQGWEFCAGTDACPGTATDDKTISSSETTTNGFDTYSATIQNSTSTYHVTVIRGAAQPDGTAPYVMFATSSTNQTALNTFAKIMASVTFDKASSSTGPYAGWQSYSSSYEKLSFRYPSGWKIKTYDYSTQITGADSATLTSPSGAVSMVWYSAVQGIGGACSTEVMPGTTPSDGSLGPCPYWYVEHKQKLAGADLYYVDGVEELSDGKGYIPWCGLQAADGITQNQSNIGYMVFPSKTNRSKASDGQDLGPIQVEFACGNDFTGTIPSTGTSKDQAEAFLTNPEMQQAKQILLSAAY